MAASVNLKIDYRAVDRVVGLSADEATRRAADITVARAKRNIRALDRIDTSAMYRGMTREKASFAPLRPVYLVYTPVPYVAYQEFGTRGHGPVRAKVLRFAPKGSSTFVFAKWVRGVTPGNFMRDAANALSVRDFLRVGP
jgi:hypothetical protein